MILSKILRFSLFLLTIPPDFTTPPTTVPEELYNAFTLNGAIPVVNIYHNDSYSSDQPLVYTYEQIQDFEIKAKAKQTYYYGAMDTYLYNALDKYISRISNKNVAVIGSVTPWYESILLSYGAHPTTIEYNKIISKDPRLEILTISEYEANPRLFDAILSVSSLEHDGLGRYGDPINPEGDLSWMNKAKKMLKKDGLLFLSVPIGQDCLVWNLHRIYGNLRLKALLKGWKIIEFFGFTPEDLKREDFWGSHQPVFVLQPNKYALLEFFDYSKSFLK